MDIPQLSLYIQSGVVVKGPGLTTEDYGIVVTLPSISLNIDPLSPSLSVNRSTELFPSYTRFPVVV